MGIKNDLENKLKDAYEQNEDKKSVSNGTFINQI